MSYLVDISMAIWTDFMRLSLICWSTGSMLWTSMLVITYTNKGYNRLWAYNTLSDKGYNRLNLNKTT